MQPFWYLAQGNISLLPNDKGQNLRLWGSHLLHLAYVYAKEKQQLHETNEFPPSVNRTATLASQGDASHFPISNKCKTNCIPCQEIHHWNVCLSCFNINRLQRVWSCGHRLKIFLGVDSDMSRSAGIFLLIFLVDLATVCRSLFTQPADFFSARIEQNSHSCLQRKIRDERAGFHMYFADQWKVHTFRFLWIIRLNCEHFPHSTRFTTWAFQQENDRFANGCWRISASASNYMSRFHFFYFLPQFTYFFHVLSRLKLNRCHSWE